MRKMTLTVHIHSLNHVSVNSLLGEPEFEDDELIDQPEDPMEQDPNQTIISTQEHQPVYNFMIHLFINC